MEAPRLSKAAKDYIQYHIRRCNPSTCTDGFCVFKFGCHYEKFCTFPFIWEKQCNCNCGLDASFLRFSASAVASLYETVLAMSRLFRTKGIPQDLLKLMFRKFVQPPRLLVPLSYSD